MCLMTQKGTVVGKVLFHTASFGLTIYLEDIPSEAADDVVIPHIRPLLGQTGRIRRLNIRKLEQHMIATKNTDL